MAARVTPEDDTPKKATLFWRDGRGRSGASTLMGTISETAFRAGRGDIVIGDGDINNDTLTRQFRGRSDILLPPPASRNFDAMKEWVSGAFDQCIGKRNTTILDLGGNDTMPSRLAEELDLMTMLKDSDVRLVVWSFMGTGFDDIENVYRSFVNGPFAKAPRVLFLNGGVGQTSTDLDAVQRHFETDSRVETMIKAGAITVTVPYLPCLAQMEKANISVFEALEGARPSSGTAQSIFWRAMTRKWYERLMENIEMTSHPELFL
ncbi:hypothetical protein [Asaia sp. As-1742]|uniref:hypothetical protein n=1 Tax=Asaia sp. As-1742 TaxID=2608325 RepID=UPI001421FB7B|nr:hypothetical protein [Asaia sp. As-1742]NIE81419.1 hypothetical protein [Asaia sp. As-1742]